MRVLLITLAIGEQYTELYNLYFRKSQEEYAKKHGYDFMVMEDYLSKIPEYNCSAVLTFHKLLVCSQPFSANYDYIIFVDADIFITHDAPPVIEGFCGIMGDNIGVVNELCQPDTEYTVEIQNTYPEYRMDRYYTDVCSAPITEGKDIIFNSGLFIAQPKKHSAFLEEIFYKYVPLSINKKKFNYEQVVFGYELLKHKKYFTLPNCWNAVRPHYKNAYKNLPNYLSIYKYWYENYFLHFAGHVDIHSVKILQMLNQNPSMSPETVREHIVDVPTVYCTTQSFDLPQIIQAIIYTETNDRKYMYNNTDPYDTLGILLNLRGTYTYHNKRKLNDELRYYTVEYIYTKFQENIDVYLETESCKRLTQVFWSNKSRPFNRTATNVVILYDKTLDDYFSIMQYIINIYKSLYTNLVFHIYSNEVPQIMGANVFNHIKEPSSATFIGMVAADILVMSNTQSCYAAALLCQGDVFYPKDFSYPCAKKWIPIA
jgi:hypothetical protein